MRVLTAMVLALALGASYAAAQTTDAAPAGPTEAAAAPDYLLNPGDVLAVKFLYNAELNEQMPIRPDGKIALPMVGEVVAAGRSAAQLRTQLMELYSRELRKPDLTVVVHTFSAQKVYVGGEVDRPGELAFTPGLTTLQAVIMAGGNRRTASTRNVVIVRNQGSDVPEILLVDLGKLTSPRAAAADVRLSPRDIVFVPQSRIAKVNLFVQQYVRDLVPMSMMLGLYYNFSPFLP